METITAGNNKPPSRLIFLLHGYGANADDLIGLAEPWREYLPEARFIAVNAPFACESAPNMPRSRQWFSMSGGSNKQALERGLRSAEPVLTRFLEKTLHKLSPQKPLPYALVGFSQGAMLAVYCGLKMAAAPSCIVSYSGAFIGLDEKPSNKSPVLAIHGRADEVVPPTLLGVSEAALENLGVPITTISYPGLGHSINAEGMAEGGKFLASHLTPAAASDLPPETSDGKNA